MPLHLPHHPSYSRSLVSIGLFLLSALAGPIALAAETPFSGPIPEKISLTVEDISIDVPAADLHDWFHFHDELLFRNTYRSEIEDIRLCPIRIPVICDLILQRSHRVTLKNSVSYTLDETAVRTSLEKLDTDRIAIVPIDAKFSIQDGKVTAFSQGKDGRKTDIEATVTTLSAALQADRNTRSLTIPLSISPVSPAIGDTDAGKLGIIEQISEGRTNFAGSPKNRIHNFTHAAKQFNGLLISPGEEFSFVKHLGPVDGEHGYLPELVIKHNRTEPEFGGGICQVSTTAFRAALNAGLEITARRNHAYPVQYYKPYGMDATIYIPKPDLRFRNNTPGHILVQTAIEDKDLVFRFYGTSDGRKTSIDGPHILSRTPDGGMKTVFTQTVTTAGGQTLIDEKFYSNYASPNKYPHPGQEPTYTEKPDDWSEKQWREYRQAHNT